MSERIREIPYNYTSFSDREIVIRLLGDEGWQILNQLREERVTGRSARMLFEVLGDIWIIERNPFIQDDLLENPKRRHALIGALKHRLQQIQQRAEGNELALQLAAATLEMIDRFEHSFAKTLQQRKEISRYLQRFTATDNIQFNGHARVAHVTDASDWRVEYPLLVLSPDSEQEIRPLVRALIELGVTIIPRGGGTGYTGGAVPLTTQSAVINTEKLDTLAPIEMITPPGIDHPVASIHVGAGCVTRRVSEAAEARDLAFAVDPTSQDASCIGGNISMNAGGKKAVMWGTTLDNLLSWRMVNPDGDWIEIERINHNLGKIHLQPESEFRITTYSDDFKTPKGNARSLKIKAAEIRKPGLGKDVTNKVLAGLPGVQKEGCDGIITSATFLLHQVPQFKRTICLEFYGDLNRAVPAIVETKSLLDADSEVDLLGLEHLDERYIRAVGYSPKATRGEHPRMLLLADIAADDESHLASVASKIVRLANLRDGEGFIATSPEAQRRFWLDRSRTAAIAAHTNAFKINEDVVIPLEHLGQYSDGIEQINIEQSTLNKIAIIDAVIDYLKGDELERLIIQIYGNDPEYLEILNRKRQAAIEKIRSLSDLWQQLLDHLNQPISELSHLLQGCGYTPSEEGKEFTLLQLLQLRRLRISYRKKVEALLKELFSGQELAPIHQKLDEIHQGIRSSRIFVATHMHAGDGNVHTNIPVHSNDYHMLQEADKVVERIMELAVSLGGVISGEHGIGLTKLAFMDRDQLDAFKEYKERVDPHGHFNRGKLLEGADLQRAYTPSLRLLQQEALILEASDLGSLNSMIKDCLRCGKCKPVCTTHVPRANLLYSPRNKILSTGLIIEAFLYEEQTRRGISIRHFEEMNDVADHCTVCHRCVTPCPVNIDFGDVSVLMRNLLRQKGKKSTAIATRLALMLLNARDPARIRLLRQVIVSWSYPIQNMLSRLGRKLKLFREKTPRSTTARKPHIQEQVIHLLQRPLPNQLEARTMRSFLGIEDDKVVPIIRNPALVNEQSDAVFYFPGCGSERLFSEIGLASLSVLYHHGVQVVMPPSYICCGYPQNATGFAEQGKAITTENQVLFHRIANTLNYLDIRTILVSCGTCLDQLMLYQLQRIFPGCRLIDIHEYLFELGIKGEERASKALYHAPCHSPIKGSNALDIIASVSGSKVELSDRCCGESGTFAISRPDIATQVRMRKQEELSRGITGLRSDKVDTIYTTCPSCQQGLHRYQQQTGLQPIYPVVQLAKEEGGEEWKRHFIEAVQHGGVERVLL